MKNTLIIVLLLIVSTPSFPTDYLLYSAVQISAHTSNYKGTIVALSLFVVLLLSLIAFVRKRNR